MTRAAAAAASAEAMQWVDVAALTAAVSAFADVPAVEADVVAFHDPGSDLLRRYREWGHEAGPDLQEVARFGAALAATEAEAWEADRPEVATRAFEARRFLLGDRVLHWAVPWLDGAGRCFPEVRDEAHLGRDVLLGLGDRHRPVPILAGGEGLVPPGEDSYGPRDGSFPEVLGSVWCGIVLFDRTIQSMTGRAATRGDLPGLLARPAFRDDLAVLFQVAAARWRRLGDEHPGSARLWVDLAVRADHTVADIGAWSLR